MTQISESAVPTHVGIILDGNRRWAKAKGLPVLEGHRQGVEVFKKIVLHGFEREIKYISAYIFSNENWRRSEKEVGFLMDMVIRAVEEYLDEFHERGIRLVILGRKEGLRSKVVDAISRAEEKTRHNDKGTLALCINYGGREEIADAANKLIESQQPITSENLCSALYAPEIPDLDFVIRTSGEQRLSGFMLWRASYAELYFSPVMWPDFTPGDFDKALEEYNNRSRRFGT